MVGNKKRPQAEFQKRRKKEIVSDKPPQANLSEKKKIIISFC